MHIEETLLDNRTLTQACEDEWGPLPEVISTVLPFSFCICTGP